MKFLTITGFFIVLATYAGLSQNQGLVFSADEAVKYALENNKTLKNAKDDLKLADQQYKEARGAGLPKVEGSVDYMTNFNYEAEINFGSGSSTPPVIDYTQLDAGDMEIMSFLNQSFGSTGPTTIKMSDQASANIQVSQLIFSGQYWVGLQLAKLGKQVRATSLNKSELDVKQQVLNSYYLILVTKELLNVIGENTKNLEEMYVHTNNMFKSGMAEQTDVDQIKINLSQLKNSKNEMERNLQLNYNMFRFILGIDSNDEIVLSDSLEKLLGNVEKESVQSDSLNLDNNPDYKLISMQEELGNKQVDMQKWAYSPTLVGFYSYKEKLMTTAFDLSPKNAAGLTLSVPIFAGGIKQAQLSQKKIELDQIKRNKDLVEEQLNIQNNQLTFELKSALDNYFTQKENVEVAHRVYNSYQNKYKQGMVSSMELTQANSNYLQAESNYISAVMKLLQSKLALNKLYNKI